MFLELLTQSLVLSVPRARLALYMYLIPLISIIRSTYNIHYLKGTDRVRHAYPKKFVKIALYFIVKNRKIHNPSMTSRKGIYITYNATMGLELRKKKLI